MFPRRWRRKFKRRPAISVVVVLLIVVVAVVRGWQAFDRTRKELPVAPLPEGEYRVVHVRDGDTIEVAYQGRDVPVRLLGIDTPETVKPNHPVEFMGPEATQFTKDFVSGGWVELRFDRRRIDKYDRYLAYVYVDGVMLNEALVRKGLARVSHYPGDNPSIHRRLRQAQEQARQAGRGIWSQDNRDGASGLRQTGRAAQCAALPDLLLRRLGSAEAAEIPGRGRSLLGA